MSKAPTDRLLAPISKDQPAGISLRYDPVYDRIQEARREDDASVPQGVWTTKLKRADWPGVVAEIEGALAKRSKDLQLAVWRVEALLQVEGLRGFIRGIRTVTALCQRFWPTMHPALEEDDIEARISPLIWLDEKMPNRIGQLPIASVEWAEGKPRPSWFDLQAALRLEPLAASKPEDYQRIVEQGAATYALVQAAMRATPVEYYRTLHGEIREAQEAVEELRTTLAKCCGDESPELRMLRDQLEKLATVAEHSVTERGAALVEPIEEPPPPPAPVDEAVEDERDAARDPEPTDVAAPEETDEEAQSAPAPAPRQRPRPSDASADLTVIASRQDAYRLLTLAADYLARIEPHSPTPHLIRRAIAWGDMPFSDLLKELIDEPDSRRAIHRLLNLPPED